MTKAKKAKTKIEPKPVFEVGQVVRWFEVWYEDDGGYYSETRIVKIVNINTNPNNRVCLIEELGDGEWHLVSMNELSNLDTMY